MNPPVRTFCEPLTRTPLPPSETPLANPTRTLCEPTAKPRGTWAQTLALAARSTGLACACSKSARACRAQPVEQSRSTGCAVALDRLSATTLAGLTRAQTTREPLTTVACGGAALGARRVQLAELALSGSSSRSIWVPLALKQAQRDNLRLTVERDKRGRTVERDRRGRAQPLSATGAAALNR